MARQFNTAHANNAAENYTLAPLSRLPPDVETLVHDKFYFVLHAPRQSGKTTAVMALADKLRQTGRYAVVFASVENGRTARTEAAVVDIVVGNLAANAEMQLPTSEWPDAESDAHRADTGRRLWRFLRAWCAKLSRPLVLFIGEIDCLENDGLMMVLSQLRMGYADRPKGFPHSICIFGMRDVRDYKVASGGLDRLASASPFNIKRESITLASFTRAEIAELYGQHTAETGQEFTDAAIDRAFAFTGGQPHLVNALANDIVARQKWTGTIDVAHIDAAKERVILQWGTHFDSLMARLREDRVRRVLEPLLAGRLTAFDTEDLSYCRDLGLIDSSKPPQMTNAIYREVVVRALTAGAQAGIPEPSRRRRTPDGRLDIDGLRMGLLEFWREHAEGFVQAEDYHEVSAQLVVMAYLQRVVNGGGQILQEYAAGTGRIDILIKWPVAGPDGRVELYGTHFENHLWELKVWSDAGKKADPKDKALVQMGEYMAKAPCVSATLVVFDRRAAALQFAWEDRLQVEAEQPVVQGVAVMVVRA